MAQFSVTLSNAFSDENSHGGSFNNALPQNLNFGYAMQEDWRMSLAEMTCHPGKWYNIRESNNLIELKIQDWAYTYPKKYIFCH